MERWQRDHIKENLSKLTEFTNCNTHLLAELQSSGILDHSECEALVILTLLVNSIPRI